MSKKCNNNKEYIVCKECGEINNLNVPSCKKCGNPFRKKLKHKKSIIILSLALFLILFISIILFSYIKNSQKIEYTDSECFTVEKGVILSYYNSCSKDIVIPKEIDGVAITEIGKEAFYNMDIKSVIFPEGLKKIGNGSFSNNLLTDLIIPNSVTKIYGSAFENNKIKKLKLGINLKLIGSWSFDYNQLEDIVIPDNVEKINYEAFGNNNLKTIVIGKSVSFIDWGVFGQYGEDYYDCTEMCNQDIGLITNKSGNSFDWYSVLSYNNEGINGPQLVLETGNIEGRYGTIKVTK